MATREQLTASGIDPDAIAFKGHTYIELHEAMRLVECEANWKSPFEAVVDGGQLEAVKDAVVFFTGGPLHKAETTRDGRVKIAGHGYYYYTKEGA